MTLLDLNESDYPSIIMVGSRKSELAMIQTNLVIEKIKEHYPGMKFAIKNVNTIGDKILEKELSKIGEKSLFTKELDIMLVNNEVDFVVHSLKDIPTLAAPGTMIASITNREDPRDVFIPSSRRVGDQLRSLPNGSVVGTSSVRRIAHLKRHYPNLSFKSIRGNLNTRLAKLDDPINGFDGIVLAAAGIKRLGQSNRVTEYLSADDFPYAVGQGALAIQCRENDQKVFNIVSCVNDLESEVRCLAERSLLRCLEGGCSVPIGVKSSLECDLGLRTVLKLSASVASLDGSVVIKDEIESLLQLSSEKTLNPDDSHKVEYVGRELGEKLMNAGALEILQSIRNM